MLGEPEANSLILGCWGAQRDTRIFNPSACLHKDMFDFHQYGDVWFLILNKKDLLRVNVSLKQRGATDSQFYPGFWKCFPWDFMRSEITVPWVSRQPEQMLFKHNIRINHHLPVHLTYLVSPLLSFLSCRSSFIKLHTFLHPFEPACKLISLPPTHTHSLQNA